jgi:flagellar basal body-associated protein FliL
VPVRLINALMLFICLFGAGAAWGSSHGAAPKKPHGEAAEPAQPAGPRIPSVAMPKLVAPIIVNGQLHHYAYLSVTLQLNDDGQKTMVLEKIPYLQDAFLREVHETSIVLDNNPDAVDKEGLAQRLVAISARVLGPGVVKNVDFLNVAHPGG